MRNDQRGGAARLHVDGVPGAGAVALQLDLVIAGREIGNRQRRDTAFGAVDENLRARRIRLNRELAGHRRLSELEVLRHFGVGRHGKWNDARHAPPAQFEDVRAGRQRHARGRPSVRHAINEHVHARRVRLDIERTHRRSNRGTAEILVGHHPAAAEGDHEGDQRGDPAVGCRRARIARRRRLRRCRERRIRIEQRFRRASRCGFHGWQADRVRGDRRVRARRRCFC